jgi:Asp-tRNA(Asn)/Glu-tRNA(Gln) amidotransferase A subunit family amidase
MSRLVSNIINVKLKFSPLTSRTDDADAIEGAPSGIQVVGRPMRDEELVQIMGVITEILKPKV